ncbi:UPF0469 protein KIAA0907 homolog [Sinocyclocheilus grahami]|uniref:UPF0469 protein KIAA0907 homolog n=1 Tax=Sinocyclocheilus grahami TaxID=75366 RepID=UPI0007ACB5A5|nr:PREDICTED: UPF0469 protein KIAA0907 homolog [Sinocyclocheilus grahami]
MPPPCAPAPVDGPRAQKADEKTPVPSLLEPQVKRVRMGLVAYAGDSSDEEEDHGAFRAAGATGWTYRCPSSPPTRPKTQTQTQPQGEQAGKMRHRISPGKQVQAPSAKSPNLRGGGREPT